MATIEYFNITADDPLKVAGFYEELFGWETRELPGADPYFLVTTRYLNGHKGGGTAKREPGQQAGFVNFIGVKSIHECLTKITEKGGSVIGQKQLVPGFGWLAIYMYPEENIFGIFEERIGKKRAARKPQNKII